jgi:outer membrane protein OmpA-like peptidoglycan-associated protein/tetratricopeptide (TPR) repeat protein
MMINLLNINGLVYIVAICASLLSFSTHAQKSDKEALADKYYDQFSYVKAINQYESLRNISIQGLRNLALAYRRTNQLEKSRQTFEKFMDNIEVTSEDIFDYATILRMNGNYDESLKWLDKFIRAKPDDNRAKIFARSSIIIPQLLKDEGRYKITHLGINTNDQEFGAAYYMNNVVFASTREGVNIIKRIYNWNERPFLNLYISELNDDMELRRPKQFRKQLNKKLHEGPAAFTSDGLFMALTRNNYEEKSSDRSIKFEIYFYKRNQKGDWELKQPFKLNNKEYNVGHAWLSSDGTIMYFSSDMPGGYGGSDIYRITRTSDNNWGDAINLGPSINTESDEMFPFYHEQMGVLFFSSNGHIGLGGLDIYFSPDMGSGKFQQVTNAGTPLNTRFDDFSLIIDENMKRGYFSSNREGGKGDDDIYALDLIKPLNIGKRVIGIAKDIRGNVLPETTVYLYDKNGVLLQSVITNQYGKFGFNVEPDSEYNLLGHKENYIDGTNTANTNTKRDEVVADLILGKDSAIALYTIVKDAKTAIPLDGVHIDIQNNLTNEVFITSITSLSGDVLKVINNKNIGDSISYKITLSKDGYFDKTIMFSQRIQKPGIVPVVITMDEKLTDLAQLIDINPIRFDLNKYTIRPDAAIELDKIVKLMNKYPDMKIELISHTDCRGSTTYNKRLSSKRAKSSAQYVQAKITNPTRIIYRGYGELSPLNDCGCKDDEFVNCTEDDHHKNRRTEYRIISIGMPILDVQK